MDDRGSVVEAMACAAGRIMAVGLDREVMPLRGGRTKVIDLRGRFACPGFIDCHTHFAKRALGITRVDLHGTRSRQEMVDRLVKARAKVPEGAWVLGRGWDDSTWPDRRFPTRHDLDAALADRPVKASRIDGHSCVVNTLGLKILDLPADLAGIERGPEGDPTGVLKEQAYEATLDRIEDPDELYRRALPRMERVAHRLGVTTVCDFVDPKDLRAYAERARQGKLRVRVAAAMWTRHLTALEAGGVGRGVGDEWLKLVGVKMYGDGSIGSRTAAMHRPYRDDASTSGGLNMTRAEMAAVIARARRLGLQTCVHAIGDRGVEEVIAAFEEAADGVPGAQFRRERHRIEHCELISRDGIRRMRRLGLVASVQPNFIGNWSRAGLLYDQRIGDTWHGKDNPLRWMVDAGLTVAFGSDNMPFGPLFGIHSAVNAPYPAQRLTVQEALAAQTRDAAFALHEETTRGTLEPGKLADVVVLSATPFDRPERIEKLRVDLTVLGGQVVLER
jgi:hypothetical protein